EAVGIDRAETSAVPRRALDGHAQQLAETTLALRVQLSGGPPQPLEVRRDHAGEERDLLLAERFVVGHHDPRLLIVLFGRSEQYGIVRTNVKPGPDPGVLCRPWSDSARRAVHTLHTEDRSVAGH